MKDYLLTEGSKLSQYGVPLLAPESGGILPLFRDLPAKPVVEYLQHHGFNWTMLKKHIAEIDQLKDPDPQPGELFKDWRARLGLFADDFDTRTRSQDPETGRYVTKERSYEDSIYEELGFNPIECEFYAANK